MDRELQTVVLDRVHCLPRWSVMPRLPNCFASSLRASSSSCGMSGQHLDDRDLGAEAVEDRGELAADDAAAEHDEPARDLLLREEAGRVDAACESSPSIGGAIGNEPVATIACLKVTSSPPSTAIVFAS
jgi:hypothetical protein